MKKSLLLFFCFISIRLIAQEATPLSIFEPFIGRTWVANGNWEDDSEFKQEITFNYDLNNSIVKTESVGYTNNELTTWGKRNHGVRQWNAETNQIDFWEFDVFGGVTSGTVHEKNENIYYQYSYSNGSENSIITDRWEKVDDQTYNFKVGVYKDGQWEKTYLNTQFIALPRYTGDRTDLNNILANTKMFSETYKKGDHMKLAMFYTSDGIIMPEGDQIIQGREAIAKRWKLREGVSIKDHQVRPEKIEIFGNRAIDYGYYRGVSVGSDGKEYPFKGKYVITWKKVDGDWLIDVDIWNQVN